MIDRTCAVPGCETRWYAREWCKRHYVRWMKRGNTDPRSIDREPAEVRFQMAVGTPMESGCIPWTGRLDRDGYGIFTVSRKNWRAHRFAYEAKFGKIPEGLVIDHFFCDMRSCVNPDHLKPVTRGANTLRSTIGITAVNAMKTHCPKKHEYTEENTRISRGKRNCRTCEKLRTSGTPRAATSC